MPPATNANYAWIQHMIHHLAPNGKIGLVLAKGSLSTTTGGEDDIRKRIIEDDLVEGIVSLPSQLFYSVTIPVCLWFISKSKKQKGKTVFIDARGLGHMVDRKHRDFTEEDINKIAETFEAFQNGSLENVKGFCAVVTTQDIKNEGFVLLPGRYVGTEDKEEDDETVSEKIKRLEQELEELSSRNKILETAVFENLQLLGYDLSTDDSELPTGWSKSNLTGIANYLNGLAMQKYRPKEGEEGIPVLKIKELRQRACDSDSELCSPNIKPEYIVHDGDVIFSWSGSLLVDIWNGGTCGLNQHLFKVTSENYDKWFYYAWTAYHLEQFAAIAADKATTMGHIKREDLAKAEVLIPTKEDYERIGALLKPLYDMMISKRTECRKIEELCGALMPKLITGEIDISNIIVNQNDLSEVPHD